MSKTETEQSDLGQSLRRHIERDGPLPLDAYWRAAMTTPGAGYYMGGQPIGAAGDFITAPEISQIFGEMIGLWLVEAWTQAGKPAPFALMELGPGRGQLMADILRAAKLAPDFIAAARIHLVEISPTLRQVQAEKLPDWRPIWHAGWRAAMEALEAMPLFLVANEFIDALPIRQFERTRAGWRERLVGLDDDAAFTFALAPVGDPPIGNLSLDVAGAPEGAILEWSPERQALAAALGRHLSDMDGAALLIDYGHGSAKLGDSLQALKSGKPANALKAPGRADITSHVDFHSFKRAAEVAGARAWGPIDQGVFLRNLGADARAAHLKRTATPEAAAEIARGLDRLLHPLAMGSLFKAMALLPAVYPPPAGFEA